ncbi:MAG: energy-coupling factor transporter transmembrane protein EcfT [Alicyclobacillus macrosporangiidus]|uniref:energy-coupling factor transporter transmembrane component T n=1 Tax=Alicyclobacillus macrosporangiidus TaxID=392015 RepID=UPI0026ECE908|nr:energy-coupling factor transporter transmembrane component T [Alicyclobacillus macrosporangiidus]MCL6600436.1 energy-coupling factor transporter transmembrane protein EcfT [Alicyclobacillus macrosporangiidus]
MRRARWRPRPHPAAMGLCALAWGVVVYRTPSWEVLLAMLVASMAVHHRMARGPGSGSGMGAVWWALPFLVLYMAIGSLFGTVAGTVWWRGPHIPGLGTLLITPGSLEDAVRRGLRLWNLLLWMAWFGRVVRPDDITCWLGRRFGRAGLTVQMVVGFVPQLLRERDRVAELLRLRAGALSSGGLRERVRMLAVVYQTLLMNGLERAWTLAESMYARGYGAPGRTAYRPPRWRGQDALLAGVSALAALMALLPLAGGPARWTEVLAAALALAAGAWTGGRQGA